MNDMTKSVLRFLGYLFGLLILGFTGFQTWSLLYADEVIVPVKTDHVSLVGARQHTDDLYNLQQEDSRKFKARVSLVVPTMMPSRQILASQVVEQMEGFYGRDLVNRPVPESVYVNDTSLFSLVSTQTFWEMILNSSIYLLTGTVVFNWAQKRVQSDGSLAHY